MVGQAQVVVEDRVPGLLGHTGFKFGRCAVKQFFFIVDPAQGVHDGRDPAQALFGLPGQIQGPVEFPALLGIEIGQVVYGRNMIRVDVQGFEVLGFGQVQLS